MSTAHDDTHDAHGAAADPPEAPTPNPAPPLNAFIWPGLIALLVLILVWGPVTGAFAHLAGGYDANGQSTPTVVPAPTQTAAPANTAVPAVVPPTSIPPALPTDTAPAATDTAAPATDTAAPATVPTAPATDTAAPALTDTPAVPATATAAPAVTDTPAAPATDTPAPPATATPVTPLPPAPTAAQAPRSVAFGGKSFRVVLSNTTVPDWIFSKDPGVANWVSGTVLNYVLGLSYSPANAALFAAVHAADTIKITRVDGSVYTFLVDQVRRVAPTDTGLLAQDHPAVTLLLLGDPAPDRAVVQGHVSQAALP